MGRLEGIIYLQGKDPIWLRVSFFIKSKLGITWRKIRGKWLDLEQGDGKGELELGGPGIEHQRGGQRALEQGAGVIAQALPA